MRLVNMPLSLFADKYAVERALSVSIGPRPKTVMNALTHEIALVLDEPEAELIVLQHIQDVLNSGRKECRFPHQSSKPRVFLGFQG